MDRSIIAYCAGSLGAGLPADSNNGGISNFKSQISDLLFEI